MSNENRPMIAVVEFEIRTETTTMTEWLDEWEKRAEDAYDHEPETTAYEAAVHVEDETRVLVYERYERGLASLQTHMERPSHKVIGEAMGARRMNKSRSLVNIAYDVPDYGWWSRPNIASPGKGADQSFILLGMSFASPEHRHRFIDMSAEHARYCWDAEPDTLVYSGAIVADFPDSNPWSADDLLFVMACTDGAAVEKHATDPNHLALGEKLRKEGVEITKAEPTQYRTTGRGFLWR